MIDPTAFTPEQLETVNTLMVNLAKSLMDDNLRNPRAFDIETLPVDPSATKGYTVSLLAGYGGVRELVIEQRDESSATRYTSKWKK